MELKSVIIGIVLVSMIVLGFSAFMGDIKKNYDLTIDDSGFTNTYNKLDQMNNQTSDMQNLIEGSNIESENAIYTMSKGAWSAMKMTFESFQIFGAMVNDFANTIGLPVWVVTGIMTIFIVTLVFIIISAIFRFNL